MDHASCYARCAGYDIHYTDWGRADRGTVIAWHGLARTGRDMDELAAHLERGAIERLVHRLRHVEEDLGDPRKPQPG